MASHNQNANESIPTPDRVWGLALRGIAAILFGLAAIFWPGLTLLTLVYLFSAFILITGVVTLIMAIVHMVQGYGSTFGHIVGMILGIAEIGVGVYLLRHTGVSFTTFVLLIGLVLIVRGLLEVISSVYDSESTTHKTLSIVGGIATTLAGVIILFQPVEGGVAFVWILGLYALITGPLLIALSLSIRKDISPPAAKQSSK